ncbi:MAG: class IV adenylate cyclase [Planctomycetota bacterium]|nr:MAG: class IV adenylate cyclase [Planctomycetota bacterium]
MYEVEMKFPAASQRVPLDRAGFTARMAALGAQRIGVQTERDVYFAHPCRDFARTDEALRLRRVGNDWQLTYKGPLVDSETKTRTELQTRLDAAAADTVRGILERLGFRPVREVRKRRELWAIEHAGRRFTISWDEVDELGRFVEIETLADERQRAEATAALKRLAETLGLTHSERRSYLCLLLEQDADGGKSTPSGD